MKNEIKRTGTARKVGRPRAYTPEALEAKFEEYVEWVKANPVYINKVSALYIERRYFLFVTYLIISRYRKAQT